MEFQPRVSDLFQLYWRYSVEVFERFNLKRKWEEIKTSGVDAQIYNESVSVKQKFVCLIKVTSLASIKVKVMSLKDFL